MYTHILKYFIDLVSFDVKSLDICIDEKFCQLIHFNTILMNTSYYIRNNFIVYLGTYMLKCIFNILCYFGKEFFSDIIWIYCN